MVNGPTPDRIFGALDLLAIESFGASCMSPCGRFLFYTVTSSQGTECTAFLYKISKGTAFEILRLPTSLNSHVHAQWCPNGNSLVIIRQDWMNQRWTIWSIDPESGILQCPPKTLRRVKAFVPTSGGCALVHQGDPQTGFGQGQSRWESGQLRSAWNRKHRGLSSALSTAAKLPNPIPRSRPDSLSLLDLSSFELRRLLKSPVIGQVCPSPASDFVAIFLNASEVEGSKQARVNHLGYSACLLEIGSGTSHEIAPLACNHSFRWASDGHALAFLTHNEGGSQAQISIFDVSNIRLLVIDRGAIEIGEHGAWLNGGWFGKDLLIERSQCGFDEATVGSGWCQISPDGNVCPFGSPDRAQIPMPHYLGSGLSCVLDKGQLEFIGPDGMTRNHIQIPDTHLDTILSTPEPATPAKHVLLLGRDPDDDHGSRSRRIISVSTTGDRVETLAELGAGYPQVGGTGTGLAWFWQAPDGVGTQLFVQRGRSAKQVHNLNAHLASFVRNTSFTFPYTDKSGREIHANVLHPPRKHDAPLPALIAIFPSFNQGPNDIFGAGFGGADFTNLQIAAAHGYAIIIPGTPEYFYDFERYKPGGAGQGGDRHGSVHDVVAAATDHLSATGLIDKNRIGLLGYSAGASASLRLLSKEPNLKAAVIVSPTSIIVSPYAAPDQKHAFSHLIEGVGCELCGKGVESDQRFVPVSHYVLNSPAHFCCAIDTPLLIVQGDEDYNELWQSAQLFDAMQRHGKKVELVRYVGEGHGISSRANAVDFWDRAFRWLDPHLLPASH